MSDLLNVLTDLSQVLGVPAALCLAWTAFIIKDHGKRIKKLEEDNTEMSRELDKKLDAIYNRINELSVAVAKIQGKMGIDE